MQLQKELIETNWNNSKKWHGDDMDEGRNEEERMGEWFYFMS